MELWSTGGYVGNSQEEYFGNSLKAIGAIDVINQINELTYEDLVSYE